MPISVLLPELLEEIFSWVVLSSIPRPSLGGHQTRSLPYDLSHVCGQWRRIALKFSSLWAHLHVERPKRLNLVDLLTQWIDRARSQPLHLSLITHHSQALENQEVRLASEAILALFVNSFHKCESFSIQFLDASFPSSLVVELDQLHPQPSDRLQTVSILGVGAGWPNAYKKLFSDLCGRAPNLYSATLDPGLIPCIQSCSNNIRVLNLPRSWNRLDLPSVIEVLSFCKNLKQLTIDCVIYTLTRNDVVVLPNLTFLSVGSQIHGSASILASFQVPSLTEIRVDIKSDSDRTWTAIVDLLKRSSAKLRVLQLRRQFSCTRGAAMHPELALAELTEPCFQELRVLEVGRTCDHSIVRILTWPPAPVVSVSNGFQDGKNRGQVESELGYLPHLQKLSVCVSVFGSSDDKRLRSDVSKMVESRMARSDSRTGTQEVLGTYGAVNIFLDLSACS